HLTACRRVFVALAAFSATLGHGFEIGNDLGFDIDVVIGEIRRIVVGRLGRTTGTAACGRRTAGLGRLLGFSALGLGSGFLDGGLFGSSLLGGRLLGRCLGIRARLGRNLYGSFGGTFGCSGRSGFLHSFLLSCQRGLTSGLGHS